MSAPAAEVARDVIAALVTALLVWTAVSDILSRRIPNAAVLALLILFIPWAAAAGGAALRSGLAAGGVALVVSLALYAVRVIGAGDSKLFSVVALFVGLGYLPALALATALAGGAIALVSLLARPRRALTMVGLRGRGDYGRGVPYGVAIALGAGLVLWSAMTGALPPFGADAAVDEQAFTAFASGAAD